MSEGQPEPDGNPQSFDVEGNITNIDDTTTEPGIDQQGYEDVSQSSRKEMKPVRRFSTFTNLVNALIGAGIVSVPCTFIECGIGPIIILLLLSAVLCYTGGNVLINLQAETGQNTLPNLATSIFGHIGETIISILVIIFSLSCTVAYLIIGASKIGDWLSNAGLNFDNTWNWALLVFLYSMCIPIMMTIPRRVGFLSSFALVTLISIAFYTVAILIRSSIELAKPGMPPESVVGYDFNSGIFSAFAIHALTFSLPVVMMPIIAPYNQSTRKRHIVTGWVYIFSFVVIAIPGLLAYMTKGADTRSDILSSYAKDDVLIIFCQIGMFLSVTFSYPAVCLSIVGSLGTMIWDSGVPELMSTKHRLILIPIVNFVNLIIAMFMKDIKPVLGIGGALGGCLVVFAFPSISRILRTPRNHWKDVRIILHFIFAIFGVFAAAVCTYYSVIDAINSFK